jgi:transcriptional regulator with XRE-family HTH domain
MGDLSTRIREKRKAENLSVREAGEVSGVAFSTLARIEAGAEPSMKVYAKIIAWLDGAAPILPPPPMTLRDWFAGQALIGLMSHSTHDHSPLFGDGEPFARDAYIVADAMIAARKDHPHA